MAYTQEQIDTAKNIDLLDYLNQRGYNLINSARNEYRLKEHDSLVISNNKWKWFSQNIGGSTLDFLTEYEKMSFKEAMNILLDERGSNVKSKCKAYNEVKNEDKEKSKELSELPEKNTNYRRVYAYLKKTRCIDYEIITDMVEAHNLYEDKEKHNCVFLGKDKAGEVKYCFKIGTSTEKKYKGEITGSDKRYNIELYSSLESDKVCVYESIIDAMSHATLIKLRGGDYKKESRISLGGVADLKLEQYLKDNPNIKNIVVCLDNDEAGINAGLKIKDNYSKLGYNITKIVPKNGKDFNDELVALENNKKKSLDDIKSGIKEYRNNGINSKTTNNKIKNIKEVMECQR